MFSSLPFPPPIVSAAMAAGDFEERQYGGRRPSELAGHMVGQLVLPVYAPVVAVGLGPQRRTCIACVTPKDPKFSVPIHGWRGMFCTAYMSMRSGASAAFMVRVIGSLCCMWSPMACTQCGVQPPDAVKLDIPAVRRVPGSRDTFGAR